MALNQQEKTQIEQNSVLQNNIENLEREQTLDVVHNYQKNLNNFQIETESHILAQNVQAQEESMLTRGINNQETSMLTQGLNNQETSMLTQGLNEQKAPQTLSKEELEKITDSITLTTTAKKRIDKCYHLKSGIQSTEGSGKSKSELKEKIERSIKDMKNMITDIERYERHGEVYNDINNYKNRLGEIIFDYYSSWEPARRIIVMGGRVPLIRGTTDSARDARRDNRDARRNAEYRENRANLDYDTALLTMLGVNRSELSQYFTAIGNGVIPETHPMYIEHTKIFQDIKELNPQYYQTIAPSGGQITYDTYCQRNPQCRYQGNNGYNPNRRYRTGTIGDDIASMIEDQQRKNGKEVNPQQREARRKIGNIGSIVGCIALGVGIFKEIFNPGKDKDGNKKRDWGKILGFGASIYGITHYKDVKNIFFDAFNLDPDNYVARRQDERAREEAQNNTGLSQSETNELINAKIAYPTLVATTIGTIPIKQLVEQKIVEEKDGKLVLNRTNYATYVENIALALGRSDKDKQEMLDKIASDEAAKSISYGLSYCGINTLNDLNNLKESETSTLMDSATFKTKFKAQIDAITRQNGIFSNMAKQGFIPTGLEETINILENYDSSKNENEQILQRLKAGLLKADPERKYSISDMLNDPDINLENMTMNGFIDSGGTEIKFDSYGDLFDAVNISNWIKDHFNRPAKSENPFHIDPLTGRIEFDNTNRYDLTHNETSVVKLLTLKKNSTLFKNREFYVSYLNKQRKENRIEQNKVDLSGYPILKRIGIDFMNEDEARNAETRLGQIKNQLRTSTPGLPGYTPFFIKGKKLGFRKIDGVELFFPDIFPNEFIGKSLNLSNFPSLTHNSDKFIKFMNDPNNDMRGYQVRQRI